VSGDTFNVATPILRYSIMLPRTRSLFLDSRAKPSSTGLIATPLTGAIITKLDGSGKGGIAVAIQEYNIAPRFIGTGETLDDFPPRTRRIRRQNPLEPVKKRRGSSRVGLDCELAPDNRRAHCAS